MKADTSVKITLEGDGTIEKRVERFIFFSHPFFFFSLLNILNQLFLGLASIEASNEWMCGLHEAEAILVATRS